MKSQGAHLAGLAVAVLVFSFWCYAQSVPGHYLYVVDCDGIVEKLDTVAERKVATYDLSTRTGKLDLVPKANGALDGCLANRTTYVNANSTFYTVVPEEADPSATGTHNYRVLGFSVPAVELVQQFLAGTDLSAPPGLSVVHGTTVRVTPASAGPPPNGVDLRNFLPEKSEAPNQILESSGSHILLRLFTANPAQLVVAVADRKLKKIVRLNDLPVTTALNIHLAPGGEYVLVETLTGPDSNGVKTGRLALFRSDTGDLLKDFEAPQTKSLFFLAISPTGRAI